MYYPKLKQTETSVKMISKFYGYNHNDNCSEQAFYNMRNMSGRAFPMLATRQKRSTFMQGVTGICGMLDKDELVYIVTWQAEDGSAGGGYIMRHDPPDENGLATGHMLELALDPDALPKQMVSMGGYIVIWPDKQFVNYAKWKSGAEMIAGTDYGAMEARFDHGTQVIRVSLCDSSGKAYGTRTVADTAPENPENGQLWVDTSDKTNAGMLKQWSQTLGMWSAIPDTWLRLECGDAFTMFDDQDGIRAALPQMMLYTDETGQWAATPLQVSGEYPVIRKQGDSVIVLKGFVAVDGTVPGYRKQLERCVRIAERYAVVNPEEFKPLTDAQIAAMTEEDLVGYCKSLNNGTYTYLQAAELVREVPDMNYITECGNRLWGCYFGEKDGQRVNEIYASALGACKVWNRFAGASTDSYAASRGADGAYTGATTYENNPLFFREGGLEKVFPSASGAHQITWTPMDGVQAGCSASLQIVGNLLLYKARRGVMAYSGALPQLISEELGGEQFYDAVAGRLDGSYYISMRNAQDEWGLYVFDTVNSLWYREDETQFEFTASTPDNLYWAENGDIKTVRPTGQIPEEAFTWYCESGNIGMNYAGRKYLSRFDIRAELQPGAEAAVYVQFDSSGRWEYRGTMRGNGLKTFVIPVRGRRCDHMRIRLAGIGQVKIYSMMRTMEKGSDYGCR